jgi:2,3-dihydro-2,3-dihydroxybenzoate dehydrogenase
MVPEAVVIGAGNGIGAEVARRLAADGAPRVWVADIDEDGAAATARSLVDLGCDGRAVHVDIADQDSVDHLVELTGAVGQVAITSAILSTTPAAEVSRVEFLQILSVNLVGVYATAQAYVKRMSREGGGAVVAVGSVAGRTPRMRRMAYGASKAGLIQALRVLALESAENGVRINTVSPGGTATRMFGVDRDRTQAAAGSLANYRGPIPVGRIAEPGDVAAVVCFLLSPAARHLNLQDIVVDGGELLGR